MISNIISSIFRNLTSTQNYGSAMYFTSNEKFINPSKKRLVYINNSEFSFCAGHLWGEAIYYINVIGVCIEESIFESNQALSAVGSGASGVSVCMQLIPEERNIKE